MKKLLTLLSIGFVTIALSVTVVHADDASSDTDASTTPDTIHLTVRDGATVAFSDTVTLPDASSSNVDIIPTGTTETHSVAARSLLAILKSIEATVSTFTLSDLKYYSSFGEFIINCITVPAATSTPECYQWQDTINGSAPSVGVDQQILNNADSVFVYFGTPRHVTLSTTTIESGQSVTATALSYNPADNTFSPTTGVTIGVTQPNPADPYTPLEIATSTVDSTGQAVFTLAATGTYNVGIKEDYYSPSATLTVIDTPVVSDDGGSGGGGGGGVSPAPRQFNVPLALAYLSSKQNADGSYNTSVITDWAAIAFAASDPGAAKTKLRNYLLTATPSLTSTTDYERHAMALESLGINPYSGTLTNVISPIVNSFDGKQFGDSSLDNDDIFGVLSLMFAGYSTTDPLLQKDVAFIISKQRPDGSWDESADMTAAAIQAVGPFFTAPGYVQATGKAAGYLASTQNADGGWGNVDSTSWVLNMANAVASQDPSHAPSWTNSFGKGPVDSLAFAQQSDGAVDDISTSPDTRIWSTSYAVVAAAGQSWDSVLQSFPIPTPALGGTGMSVNTTTATGTTPSIMSAATSTQNVIVDATTTVPVIGTSTPPVVTEIVSTTTSTTTTTHFTKPFRKLLVHTSQKNTQPNTPPAASTQTAAAGSADIPNVFGIIWHFLTHLFSHT